MWQHPSVNDRLDKLEDTLSQFFRGSSHSPAEGGRATLDHHLTHLIKHMEIRLMAAIDDLKAAVARETDVENSVLTLLAGISQQLKDAQAANDPQAIADVIATIDANTAKLSAAVTANTPAA